MTVELAEIKKSELKTAFKMQFKGFLPTFLKYRDWGYNPVFDKYSKLEMCFNSKNLFMFFIKSGGLAVGQIWIIKENDVIRLSRLFVLKKFQNQGIATQAVLQAENLFDSPKRWRLDTIKQEKNNCCLYEKLGYKQLGPEKKINKKMTIIEYEKEIQ